MSDALDRVLQEARENLGKEAAGRVDWETVDRELFARIAREDRAERARLAPGGRLSWAAGALVVSAAAAVALLVGRSHERVSLDDATAVADEPAGDVVSVEGGGELLINGKPASAGATLRLHDVVEARGTQAMFERPGRVTYFFERGARATVERVQGALVLRLDAGAVEAQVVPVARGEAFAVDVGRSRVAVHGTRLRVGREAGHVVVDLNEGVVSVGEAPRVGSTSGALVTAPAHAEFAAEDALGTLTVTHDLSAVRAPSSFGGPSSQASRAGASSPVAPAVPPPVRAEPAEAPHAGAAGAVAAAPPRVEHQTPAAGSQPQASPADPNAEADLATAVRACLAERPSAENVTVSVSTTLHLALRDDGSVRSARFEPPVAPDVNACAAQWIYKTRFTHGGTAAIAVDFKVPSSAP